MEYPVVKEGIVPENERAFFYGLGDLNIGQTKIRDREYMTVSITVKKREGLTRRRDILKATLGKWGEVRGEGEETKIFLDPSTFQFLKKSMKRNFLDARKLFGSHAFALLLYQTTDEAGNTISHLNREYLQDIMARFEKMYNFSMGHLSHRSRSDRRKARVVDRYYINMDNAGLVQGTLASDPNVQSLPFFKNLVHIGRGSR